MDDNQAIQPFKQQMDLGEIFAESGMFPDIKSQAQAVVKILAGQELKLTPFESMASIYMVSGRLALTSKAMASLIKRSKLYDYKIKKMDETECAIAFLRVDSEQPVEIGESVFTIKDAAKALLVNKDNWKAYPKNMLFARALSNGCRFYCPDVISGYYTTEELEDAQEIKTSKTTIEVPIEPQTP